MMLPNSATTSTESMKVTDYLVFAVLLLVILGGGALLRMGVRNMWRGIASASWPRVPGTVVQSSTGTDVSVDQKTHKQTTDYVASISFRYHVNGREYTTSTLHFGQTFGSGDPADAELRHIRYPEGSTVSIAYNPSDPSIAAAEAGFDMESLWLVVAGLAFTLPCVMAGIIYYTSMVRGGYESVGMGIGVAIFGSIFAALGIAALCGGITNLSRAHSSEHWPKAPGVIRYAKLMRDAPDQGAAASYSTNLVYEYDVEGRKYFGKVRRFGVLNGDIRQEGEAIERYPVGTEVTVAYSPVNPNVAALEPGVQGTTYVLAGVGVALLLFSTAVFIWVVPGVMRF